MIKETFNPIIREETYQTSFFPKIPVPDVNSVILLIAGDDIRHALCIRTGNNVKPAALKKSKYDRLVEIDMRSHRVEIEMSLLSKDHVDYFNLHIRMSAMITEPQIFLEEKFTDVATRLENELKPTFQVLADCYEMEDIDNFKEAARNELSHFTLTKCGITLSNCDVNITVDDSYSAYLRQQKEIQRRTQLEQDKAKSAEIIADYYRKSDAVAFSGVADGKYSSEEAYLKLLDYKYKEFQTNLESTNKIIDMVEGMKNKGMISEAKADEYLESFILGMISNSGVASSIASKERKGIDKKVDAEENLFAPFDDE